MHQQLAASSPAARCAADHLDSAETRRRPAGRRLRRGRSPAWTQVRAGARRNARQLVRDAAAAHQQPALPREPAARTATSLTLSVVRALRQAGRAGLRAAPSSIARRSATPDYLAVDLSAESGPHGHQPLPRDARGRAARRAPDLPAFRLCLRAQHAGAPRHAWPTSRPSAATRWASPSSARRPSGQPDYIRGLRGLVERNAMRYFLTLDAYLDGSARRRRSGPRTPAALVRGRRALSGAAARDRPRDLPREQARRPAARRRRR